MDREADTPGGIRAGSIDADNVVDRVQLQGNDADAASGLISLAKAIRRGGITADDIHTRNLVSGLQYISNPQEATIGDLQRELEALHRQLQQSVAAGEIPDGEDAEDAQEALATAQAELRAPQPRASRVIRKLSELTEIITHSAQVSEAAGRLTAGVIKLAPVAATVWQVAQRLLGG